jgi:uncharacterized protein
VSTVLLDVHVRLALGWADHEHHALAVNRLRKGQIWATTTITELGFIRLSSTPGIFRQTAGPNQAAALLNELKSDRWHRFVSDQPEPTTLDWSRVLGNKQTTDFYLIAVAQSNNAHLLTLDQRLKNAFPNAAVELLS